jgi:hypothetical protein
LSSLLLGLWQSHHVREHMVKQSNPPHGSIRSEEKKGSRGPTILFKSTPQPWSEDFLPGPSS